MKKLTIEKILPYAAYGLNGWVTDLKGYETPIIFKEQKLESICLVDKILTFTDATDVYLEEPIETIFKPILRPLSDLKNNKLIESWFTAEGAIQLTEYISKPGELTITATYKMMGEPFTNFIINRNSIDLTDFWIVQKLLENHFDIFNLIPDGLAIDINTISQEININELEVTFETVKPN